MAELSRLVYFFPMNFSAQRFTPVCSVHDLIAESEALSAEFCCWCKASSQTSWHGHAACTLRTARHCMWCLFATVSFSCLVSIPFQSAVLLTASSSRASLRQVLPSPWPCWPSKCLAALSQTCWAWYLRLESYLPRWDSDQYPTATPSNKANKHWRMQTNSWW